MSALVLALAVAAAGAPVPRKNPFVVRFAKGGKRLTYVAARHETDRRSETFRLIREAFDKDKPRAVLIEGYPASKGLDPLGFAAFARRSCGDPFCLGGEHAYAVLLALERGAHFSGGEPDDGEVLAGLESRGYRREDMLGFYFLRHIPQYRRERKLRADQLPRLFAEYFDAKSGVAAPAGWDFEAFRRWYKAKNGKPFSLRTFDDDEAAPKAEGAFFTQRVSHAVNLSRDARAVSRARELLEAHGSLLIVFGGSHYDEQEPGLKEFMGEPH